MLSSEISIIEMPEWFRTERNTGKTIEKLCSVKELDYYLRNSDEYIRRLAILRLHKLTDKESLYILKEFLDDPIESDENKYLAAWVLKSLSKKWGADIYLSSRYLNKFSGNESFEELFGIKQGYSSSSVEFDFSSSLSYSALKLDSDESALERDAFFETEFDFKKWFSAYGSKMLKTSTIAICAVPRFIIKLPVLLVRVIYSSIKKISHANAKKDEIKAESIDRPQKPKRIKKLKQNKQNKQKRQTNTSYDYYSLRKELYKKPGIISFIKKGVFQLLYFLFFPVRFALRHKLAIFCFFLLTYMLLAFTDYGRAFTNKYMDIDLRELQDSTVQKVKEYSTYALNEFNRISGINEWKKKEDSRQLNSPDTLKTDDVSDLILAGSKLYTVTAKKGLNIRKSPDSASDKVGTVSLAFGSTVTYLSKVTEDTSGGTWYYIESQDGRVGWVSAMYLKEKKEG